MSTRVGMGAKKNAPKENNKLVKELEGLKKELELANKEKEELVKELEGLKTSQK